MSSTVVDNSDFYREVAANQVLWCIKDDVGFPAPIGGKGGRAMPFWANETRAREEIANVPAFREFEPVAIAWDIFCAQWLPGMERDSLLAGVNWSSISAVSSDVTPGELKALVDAELVSRN